MPGPEQFTVAFERLTMGRQYLLRYALRKIEQSIAPGLEKEIKTSDLVHIEHVMPQTLSPEWRLALGEDVARHGEFVNRWGNLTLFFAGLNIPASNKAFEEKKSYYVDSQVDLTRRLCEYETWGPAQIEERQRWLAEVAEQLWRVDELTSASPVTTPSETLERFRAATGELWSRVEPLCVETSTDEMRQLAERLPAHLVAHQGHKEQAEQLSNLLLALLAPWDAYDASQRTVARAAAAYFLEAVDAVPDELEGGLADDEVVVRAALEALGIEESAAA
jgi:uncharacterized membrane protein YkvA (DUF1232 family)